MHGKVPVDDRSMFLTFSEGHQVYKWEIRKLFIHYFGEYLDYIDMKWKSRDAEVLFMCVVFHEASTIDVILQGTTKAKFKVNVKKCGLVSLNVKTAENRSQYLDPKFPVMIFD